MVDKKANSFTIYLIKEWVKESEILNKKDLENTDITWVWKVYYKQGEKKTPKWMDFFWSENFEGIFSSNVSGAFIEKWWNRFFALVFWTWWRFLLNKWIHEERFWLKVTLNSVKKDSIKAVDVTNLEWNWLQSRIQSVKPNSSENFWFDIERDLVKAITWRSKDDTKYWTILTGKDSLNVRIKLDITELKSFLWILLEQYENKEYEKDFPWINSLYEIENIIDWKECYWYKFLNDKLIEEINKSEPEGVHLSIPDIIDWSDFWGFSYKTWKKKELVDNLSIVQFKKAIWDEVKFDDIKRKSIYLYSSLSETYKDHWKIKDCIYFEYHDDKKNQTYILTWWKWFKIKDSLVSDVNTYFKNIDRNNEFTIIDYSDDHKDENEYNEAFAKENNCLALDKALTNIQWHSSFELCDILSPNKHLIHIKRYSGSSVLSHLFNQWFVSANYLLDKEIRRKVINNLKDKLIWDFEIKEDDRPNNTWYSIVYWIIKKDNWKEFDIPFFSKMTLMHIVKTLTNIWYKVSIFTIKDEKIKKKKELP